MKKKFEPIEKIKLRELLNTSIRDGRDKIKRARAERSKRKLKLIIKVFESAVSYITELIEKEAQSNKE